MLNKKNIVKKRDINILKSLQKEINMNTKVVPDKTKYSRKKKHKNIKNDYHKVINKDNFMMII